MFNENVEDKKMLCVTRVTKYVEVNYININKNNEYLKLDINKKNVKFLILLSVGEIFLKENIPNITVEKIIEKSKQIVSIFIQKNLLYRNIINYFCSYNSILNYYSNELILNDMDIDKKYYDNLQKNIILINDFLENKKNVPEKDIEINVKNTKNDKIENIFKNNFKFNSILDIYVENTNQLYYFESKNIEEFTLNVYETIRGECYILDESVRGFVLTNFECFIKDVINGIFGEVVNIPFERIVFSKEFLENYGIHNKIRNIFNNFKYFENSTAKYKNSKSIEIPFQELLVKTIKKHDYKLIYSNYLVNKPKDDFVISYNIELSNKECINIYTEYPKHMIEAFLENKTNELKYVINFINSILKNYNNLTIGYILQTAYNIENDIISFYTLKENDLKDTDFTIEKLDPRKYEVKKEDIKKESEINNTIYYNLNKSKFYLDFLKIAGKHNIDWEKGDSRLFVGRHLLELKNENKTYLVTISNMGLDSVILNSKKINSFISELKKLNLEIKGVENV